MTDAFNNPNRVRIGKLVPDEWWDMSWYVATCKLGHDMAAREHLEEQGLPVFVLEGNGMKRIGPRNGRRELVEYAVLPGYLFIADVPGALMALSRQRMQAVWHTCRHVNARAAESGGQSTQYLSGGSVIVRDTLTHVTGFVGNGDTAHKVNGRVMHDLFAAHDNEEFVSRSKMDRVRSRIKEGDRVEIIDGPFEYSTSIINRIRNANSVDITVEIFGQRVVTNVPLDSLEKIQP